MTITAIHPLRLILAGGFVLLGLMLSLWITALWPYVYPSTRPTFLIIGATLGALILRSSLPPEGRRGLTALTIVLALAWISIALFEIGRLVLFALETIAQWRRAGAAPSLSLRAGLGVFTGMTQAQKCGYATCVALAVPPVLRLLFSVAALISRKNQDRTAKSGPWQARWMGEADVRRLQRIPTGLPLGLKGGKLLRYEPDPSAGWRGGHHAVIAGTRAGKGVSVVIPAIIDHQGPVVVLDVKGENFAITRRHRRSLGRRVVTLNPFSVVEPSQDGFNPLDYVDPSRMVRDIDVIAEGLVRPEPGSGAHFSALASQIIAAAIEVALQNPDHAARNLNSVADTLFAPDFEARLKAWCSPEQPHGRRAAQAAGMLLAAGDNERGGVRTTIKKAFEWARSDEVRSFLARSSFSMDELLDDQIDLFIVVPLDQLEAQSVFMRLLVNLVLGAFVRQDGRRVAQRRVLLVLDEFVRLGRMEKLLSVANVAAGAGVEALFVTQDKGQVETVYGKGDTDSLLGSCVTMRVFGLGRAESNTSEWAANALGDRTILTQSRQGASRPGESSRISTSEQKQKLMTADQILEMPADEMLCLIGSKPPIKLKALISHAHPEYKSKLDANPTRRLNARVVILGL